MECKITLSKYSAMKQMYELINIIKVADEEGAALEKFLDEGTNLEEFYHYKIEYSTGIIFSRYSTYADALGYVRMRKLMKERPEQMNVNPIAHEQTK